MLILGSTLGLRIGEIVRVHVDDVEFEVDGPVLRVLGKGNKRRSVPLTDSFAEELVAWCQQHGGWAFPSQRGGHLKFHSASALVNAVLPAPWTAHTLRHRFATRAYAVERDILTLQKLLGHSSVATTMVYAKPPRDSMLRAMNGAMLESERRTHPYASLDLRENGTITRLADDRIEFADERGKSIIIMIDMKQLRTAIG